MRVSAHALFRVRREFDSAITENRPVDPFSFIRDCSQFVIESPTKIHVRRDGQPRRIIELPTSERNVGNYIPRPQLEGGMMRVS